MTHRTVKDGPWTQIHRRQMRVTKVITKRCRKCRKKTKHVVFHDATHVCTECCGTYIRGQWKLAREVYRLSIAEFNLRQISLS